MKKKILSAIIILAGLTISYLIYYSEYNIHNDMASLKKGIEHFTNYNITIQKVAERSNILFVFFTANSDSDAFGIAPLYKGINNLYQIRTVSRGSKSGYGFRTYEAKLKGTSLTDLNMYKSNSHDSSLLAVYGQNTDFMIDKILIQDTNFKQEVTVINEDCFLYVYPVTKYEFLEQKIKMFDSSGNDITEYIAKKNSGGRQFSGSQSKVELFIMDYQIELVVIITTIIVILINRKKPHPTHDNGNQSV